MLSIGASVSSTWGGMLILTTTTSCWSLTAVTFARPTFVPSLSLMLSSNLLLNG